MSKVIKKDRGNAFPLFQCRVVGSVPPGGLLAFKPRQIDPDDPSSCGPTSQETSSTLRGEATNGPLDGVSEGISLETEVPPARSAPTSETDVEAIRQRAFQEGYAEGEQAGAERGASQFQAAVAALAQTVQELASHKPHLRTEAERELVELAFAIARRIIRRELSVDPTTVVGIVHACLEELGRTEIHRLKVNPQDLELISQCFQEHVSQNLEIVADPSVSPGGAAFHTSQGRLDARIETQLEEIEQGLADG